MIRLASIVLFLLLPISVAFGGGHSQQAGILNISMKVPDSEVALMDELFAAHEKWIKETHFLSGNEEPVLVSYKVLKSPDFKNPIDPSQGTTGNTIYVLSEVYERPAGLKKHMDLNFPRGPEMRKILGKYWPTVTFVAFPEVIASYP